MGGGPLPLLGLGSLTAGSGPLSSTSGFPWSRVGHPGKKGSPFPRLFAHSHPTAAVSSCVPPFLPGSISLPAASPCQEPQKHLQKLVSNIQLVPGASPSPLNSAALGSSSQDCPSTTALLAQLPRPAVPNMPQL